MQSEVGAGLGLSDKWRIDYLDTRIEINYEQLDKECYLDDVEIVMKFEDVWTISK